MLCKSVNDKALDVSDKLKQIENTKITEQQGVKLSDYLVKLEEDKESVRIIKKVLNNLKEFMEMNENIIKINWKLFLKLLEFDCVFDLLNSEELNKYKIKIINKKFLIQHKKLLENDDEKAFNELEERFKLTLAGLHAKRY